MTKDIKLLNHQYDFLIAEKNTLLVAGYSAGKSFAGTVKTIYMKMMYPDKKVAYYLPHYGLVRDIAFDKFPEILDLMGLTYKLNRTDKELHIDNFGTIIFRSMDNADTIVGYEVAYSLIDEADILPMDKMEKVYNKILGRNRAVENARVDAVSTPEGYKWLYNQSKSGNFDVIRAKTMDNKHTPLDFIETLKQQYPSQLLQAYLEGHFVNLSTGNVFPYFNREIHNSNETMKPNETLYIGQDFNYNACVSIVFVKRDNILIAVDEIVSKDTRGVVQNIKSIYKNNIIQIYPDASGNSNKTSASDTDISILRQGGFLVFVNNSNPAIRDRINITNNCFEKNIVKVNTNKCKKLTEALEQLAFDPKTNMPEKFSEHPSKDDYCDSLGYCLSYLFPINKPSSQGKLHRY